MDDHSALRKRSPESHLRPDEFRFHAVQVNQTFRQKNATRLVAVPAITARTNGYPIVQFNSGMFQADACVLKFIPYKPAIKLSGMQYPCSHDAR